LSCTTEAYTEIKLKGTDPDGNMAKDSRHTTIATTEHEQ